MKSSAFLIFFFINSYSGADFLEDYSAFNEEDFKEDLFLYEPESDNITTKVYDISIQEDEDIELTTINFTTAQITSTEKKDEGDFIDDIKLKKEKENNVSKQENQKNEIFSSLPESQGAPRIYLEELSQAQQRNNKQYLRVNDINSNQTLIRREVGNDAWSYDTEDSVDGVETFLVNDENYFLNEMKPSQIEYLDYSNLQDGKGALEINNTTNRTVAYAEANGQQYLQKNYYYNYYPVIRKNPKTQKWITDNKGSFSEHNKKRRKPGYRKYSGKNSCKQYLEFLKFAFEKLDEYPEYEYNDPRNDYDYDYDFQNDFERSMFKTQLYGPSLYIDNSGKVFQIDPERKTYQNIKSSTSINPKMFTKYTQPSNPLTHSTNLPVETSTVSKIILPITTSSARSAGHIITTNFFPPTTKIPESFGYTQKDAYEYKLRKLTPKVNSLTPEDKTSSTNFKFYSTPWLRAEGLNEKIPPTLETYVVPKTKLPSTKLNLWTILSSTTTTTTTTPPPTRHYPSTEEEEDYYTIKANENYSDETIKDGSDCNDKMLPCPVTYNITYPLNGYCNRFVSCESGTAIRRTCPEGLHFNLITRSCDLPHNSICAYACPKTDGYYGIPGDCGGYFKCHNSVAEYRMCPPKMHWNSKTEICTFEELSSCPMKCTEKNEIKRYDGNCQAYIICLQGIAYYHKCPANTNFDPKVMTCIPEHLSKCQNNPKLLTKYLNPNHLCRDVNMKMAPGIPCDLPKKRKEKEIMQH